VHASAGPLLVLGDAVPIFVDGVVLAGAFLGGAPVGWAVALSTVAHEVPQEIGEYVIYLQSGWTRRRAILLNLYTSFASVAGGVVGYLFLSRTRVLGPYLLGFAAAGFLYVALADLVPAQRGRERPRVILLDLVLVVAGIATIALIRHEH
jgi:zinc and cadmium transporter